MTVKEFVDGYVNGGKREAYVEKHVKKTYLPIDEKLRICESIAHTTTHTRDEATGRERYAVNTPVRFVLFMMTTIDRYTDVDVDFENLAAEFDSLDKHGLIDLVIAHIDGHEFTTFNTFLEMAVDDISENERDIVSWLDNLKDAISLVLAETQKAIEEQATNIEADA